MPNIKCVVKQCHFYGKGNKCTKKTSVQMKPKYNFNKTPAVTICCNSFKGASLKKIAGVA